jgi:hypothetical protein
MRLQGMPDVADGGAKRSGISVGRDTLSVLDGKVREKMLTGAQAIPNAGWRGGIGKRLEEGKGSCTRSCWRKVTPD